MSRTVRSVPGSSLENAGHGTKPNKKSRGSRTKSICGVTLSVGGTPRNTAPHSVSRNADAKSSHGSVGLLSYGQWASERPIALCAVKISKQQPSTFGGSSSSFKDSGSGTPTGNYQTPTLSAIEARGFLFHSVCRMGLSANTPMVKATRFEAKERRSSHWRSLEPIRTHQTCWRRQRLSPKALRAK